MFPCKDDKGTSAQAQPKEVELGWGGTAILNNTAREILELRAKNNESLREIKEGTKQEFQQCQERSARVLRPTFEVPP